MITAKVIVNGKPLDDYTHEELRQIIINQQAHIARQSEIWQEQLSKLRRIDHYRRETDRAAFLAVLMIGGAIGLLAGLIK